MFNHSPYLHLFFPVHPSVAVMGPLTKLLQANTILKYAIIVGVSRAPSDDEFVRAVATHASLRYIGYSYVLTRVDNDGCV